MKTDSGSDSGSALPSGPIRAHAIRLDPGEDVAPALEKAAAIAMQTSQSSSAFVLTAVGSLDEVTLRMANATSHDQGGNSNLRQWNERLEIVSLVGTFSADGKHLHMCVTDGNGQAWGGHFVSGRIFTTLELVLGTIDNVGFQRQMDSQTGYKELVVVSQDNEATNQDNK